MIEVATSVGVNHREMKKAVSEMSSALGAAWNQIRSLEEWRGNSSGGIGGGMKWDQHGSEQQRAVFHQYDSANVKGLQVRFMLFLCCFLLRFVLKMMDLTGP